MNCFINLTSTTFQEDNNRSNLYIVVVSYNQPRLCPNASWNASAITFANSSLVGLNPFGIFISINNTIYVSAKSMNLIRIWNERNNTPVSIITGTFNNAHGLFVTLNGDVYIDDGSNHRIQRRSSNSNGTMMISRPMINGTCYGVFVDLDNAVYCSVEQSQIVVKVRFNSTNITSSIVAGNGSVGSSADTLRYPQGIFVDKNLDLYVADCSNNRIQKFRCGEKNATTMAGTGASRTMNLTCPSGVILDGDKYLYIVDNNNHRIIRSGNNQSQCILGCSGSAGTAATQLDSPQSLSFDSFGNLFVVDNDNHRIQKFLFDQSSCRK